MLKKLLIVFAVFVVAIVAFLVVASMQPADLRVQRSITIAAPPATVFPHVNDLRKFQEWSPWAKLDPNVKMTYEGPEAGTGAKYEWVGNDKVGAGAMSITDSRPNERIDFKLEFKKPMEATNTADFVFKPEGDQTSVTWGMSGQKNLIMKAVGMFMDCEKMIAPDFEKGLANLKTIAETETAKK
jgi:uncharacterized protein YndB with AHSA1/START domain